MFLGLVNAALKRAYPQGTLTGVDSATEKKSSTVTTSVPPIGLVSPPVAAELAMTGQ